MATITTRVDKGSPLTNTEMDDNLTNLNTKPDVSSGAGAPGTTPGKVGDVYIDTTNDLAYVATDTSSSADWDQVVATASTQTLTNKTHTNIILDGSVTEETYAWTSTTGSVTTELEPANGTVQRVTLTGNITSLTDNVANGEWISLAIDDGTAYTITWPTIQWENNAGSAPTLATSGYTRVVIWKEN